MAENDETLFSIIVFSDEVTFYVRGRVNHHSVHIWGLHHLHRVVEHHQDSPKGNTFCDVAQDKIYGPFSLKETLSQNQRISKCSKIGYSLYSIQFQ